MNKINVIIADDEEQNTRIYKRILEKNENFNIIHIANNGEDEYNKILELKPQLVITDNQMPKLNGVDVIEKINNSDIQEKPYFIVISGDYSYEFIQKCINLNAYRVFGKPINGESLLYCLDEIFDIFNPTNNQTDFNITNNKNNKNNKKSFFDFLKNKRKEA